MIGQGYRLSGTCPDGTAIGFRLAADRVIVGRKGDLLLRHESVSRHHALIERRAEGWLLSDLGSSNGTTVNGISIARHFLSIGDTVCFGKVRLTVEAAPEEAAEPAPGLVRRPDDEGETGLFDPATMTFASGGDERGAMGMLRRLATADYDSAQRAFQALAEDVAGVKGVRRVRLELAHGALGAAADVSCRAGAATGRYAAEVEDRLMAAARQAGDPAALKGGARVKPAEACDLMALPLQARGGALAGVLVVEADGVFDGGARAGLAAEAMGLEIALGVWSGIIGLYARLRQRPSGAGSTPVMVGRSEAFQAAVRLAIRAARSDATVLLFGESGTGKELFARLVFDESTRRTKPFVAVHSSAIEPTLMGSALFGHEKGAFTGAVAQKKGLFEEADGGTIFLDEIGELSPEMQVKLLRVLQEGEFMRVGGTETIRVDVRVICATNRDLKAAVKEGKFREDLYYRLNVIQIQLPSLRERRGDVPDLVSYFVETLGGRTRSVSEAAMAALCAYSWPGNIRELRNVVERTLVLGEADRIEVGDLPDEVTGVTLGAKGGVAAAVAAGANDAGTAALVDMERHHIRAVLEACGGNKRLAAEKLGISRSTLYEKLKEECPVTGRSCCTEIGQGSEG